MSTSDSGALLLRGAAKTRTAILLALVFAVPTLFLWGVTNDPFNVPKLALLVVGVVSAFGIRVTEGLWGRRAGKPDLVWPGAFILVPLAASWLATDYKGWSLLGEYRRFEGLVPALLLVVMALLVAETFTQRLGPLAWTLGASAAVVAAYTMAQSVGLDPLGVVAVEYAPSTLGQSNFVGGFLAICLPVLLGLWWVEPGRRRYVAALAAVLVSLGIIFAFSQGGWAAALAGAAAFATFVHRGRNRWSHLGVAVASVIAVGVVALVIAGLFLPSGSFIPPTVRARGMWWQSAVEMGLDSPVWGQGPNVYAIEGSHYRTPEDAVAHEMAFSDAPHSVPLSFFANAGVLGLLGFVALLAWTLRRIFTMPSMTPVEAGFGAATIAYFVQSLGSLDSLVLGFAFWVCLGALAARSTRPSAATSGDLRAPRLSLGITIAVVISGVAAVWSGRFLMADVHIQRAIAAFEGARPSEGEERFRSGLQLRSDPQYRTLFVDALGRAALRDPDEGRPYIDKMRDAADYLADYPSVAALSVYATRLHQWAAFAPDARRQALAAIQAAHRLDPYNPVLVTYLSEALVHAGQPRDAVEVAERLQEVIEDDFPAYRHSHLQIPAIVSVAAHASGDERLAHDALETALGWAPVADVTDCHVLIAIVLDEGSGARELEELTERYPNLLFCSPATLALLPGFEPDDV